MQAGPPSLPPSVPSVWPKIENRAGVVLLDCRLVICPGRFLLIHVGAERLGFVPYRDRAVPPTLGLHPAHA